MWRPNTADSLIKSCRVVYGDEVIDCKHANPEDRKDCDHCWTDYKIDEFIKKNMEQEEKEKGKRKYWCDECDTFKPYQCQHTRVIKD